MIAFWAVLKNDLNRMLEHKSRILLLLILTTGAVVAALFFNTKAEIAANIAHVSPERRSSLSSPYLHVTLLDAQPPLSDLVSGKYDAVVMDLDGGAYDIRTIKSDDFKQMLATLLTSPQEYHPDMAGHRKVGTNIVGFLIMFILMQGMTLTLLFAEDKERGQITRVATSPVSFTGYLCAHSLFTLLFMMIPTMVILYTVKAILGVQIGFALWQYLLLIFILCAFATALALFLHAVIHKSDSANMAGSAIAVLTSVLAGSFYSFDKGNPILETLIKVLPQKSYLTFANGLESGVDMWTLVPHFTYLVGLTLCFFLIAVVKTRRDYVRR